jgi:hypothetical protein
MPLRNIDRLLGPAWLATAACGCGQSVIVKPDVAPEAPRVNLRRRASCVTCSLSAEALCNRYALEVKADALRCSIRIVCASGPVRARRRRFGWNGDGDSAKQSGRSGRQHPQRYARFAAGKRRTARSFADIGNVQFPAVATTATIALSASATAPPGVGLESLRRTESGTLTIDEYVTIIAPISITCRASPRSR